MHTEGNYSTLAGAVIGLARACTNHGRSENAEKAILKGLAALSEEHSEEELNTLTESIRRIKAETAPGCAECPNPCGATEDYSLSALASDEAAELKINILEMLSSAAKANKAMDISAVIKALFLIPLDLEKERFIRLNEEISELTSHT